MKKLTVALLSGGVSSEREVSISSGNQVYEALDKDKYRIRRYDPKTDLGQLVADAADIDMAVIILHGPFGEDGTVQGLLDLLDIPYQGSGVLGSAVAMDKSLSKRLYEKDGIPTPDFLAIKKRDVMDETAWVEKLGLPLVVKPSAAGSSVGMAIVKSKEKLKTAVEEAFKHDTTVLLEAYVKGIELTCGVIGNDALEAFPLIEIVPDEKYEFFDYTAKYTAGETQEICPARISESLTKKAQRYAKKAHLSMCCEGYSRTDMILDGEEIFVLETNTIPGMTATSLLPQAAQVAGISFTQLMDRLIELGMERHRNRKIGQNSH
jgi:D-alanine-D-alanine ligase